MQKSEAYPPRYFRADVPDNWTLQVEIEMSRLEEFDGDNGKVKKLVVYFKRQRSGLVVGSVIWDQLAHATGHDDSDKWIGHVVELYKTTTPFGRKIVPCIRVRKVDAKKPAPKLVTAEPELNDEVPF